jgi:hypothetical protein
MGVGAALAIIERLASDLRECGCLLRQGAGATGVWSTGYIHFVVLLRALERLFLRHI